MRVYTTDTSFIVHEVQLFTQRICCIRQHNFIRMAIMRENPRVKYGSEEYFDSGFFKG